MHENLGSKTYFQNEYINYDQDSMQYVIKFCESDLKFLRYYVIFSFMTVDGLNQLFWSWMSELKDSSIQILLILF